MGVIRLARVRLVEIRLPLKEPFRTANSLLVDRRVLLLELTDADGTTSWSECVAEADRGYSDETVDSCWAVLSEHIVPRSIGRDFPSPQAIHADLAVSYPSNRMARAAVEMGSWNLAALKHGKPLATLLSADLHPPREKIPAGIAIGKQDTPAQLADRCLHAVDDGYRRIKIKISPGSDVEFIAAARDAVPSRISLSVDGNRSYSLTDNDAGALCWLDEMALTMIEQPLADHVQNAALQRAISTPICLDESILGVGDVDEMMMMESGKIVNVKPGRVGGLTEAMAIHDLCVAQRIPLWCGGMNETGIGRAYNVALASLPGFTLPGDLSPSSRYWDRDIVLPEWTMDAAGFIEVPLADPGLGVDVDTEHIDSLTVREKVITAKT